MKRKNILNYLGLSKYDSVDIKFVDGNQQPKICGKGWYFTNKSGDVIRYPVAYGKIGWSSMQYHCSTRHIVVGENWTLSNCGN